MDVEKLCELSEVANVIPSDQPEVDSLSLVHSQGDGGNCARCATPWPCDPLNEAIARANAAAANGDGKAPLPWRAVVFLTNREDLRTGRAIFWCESREDAESKAVAELEVRREAQGDWLGGPEGVSCEAEIVAPSRRVVRRCYLLHADGPLVWDDDLDEQPDPEVR